MLGAKIIIDAASLLKWAGVLAAKERAVKLAVVKTLNKVGETIIDEMADAAAAQTGLPIEMVRNAMQVTKATLEDPSFEVNASRVFTETTTRKMPGMRRFARRPEGYFHAQEMVNVITFEDNKVCEICTEIAEEGPYTIEEIRALTDKNVYGGGMFHPNCRCAVTSYRSRRELPIQFKKGRKTEVSRITLTQLASKLKNEMKVSLKAK